MARYRYTAPETTSRNLARIEAITINPTEGKVEIVTSFGDDSGGSYVEERREVFTMGEDAPLPAAVQTTVDGLVTRAFAFLQARAVIPAGTEEA